MNKRNASIKPQYLSPKGIKEWQKKIYDMLSIVRLIKHFKKYNFRDKSLITIETVTFYKRKFNIWRRNKI